MAALYRGAVTEANVSRRQSSWACFIVGACLVVLFLGMIFPRLAKSPIRSTAKAGFLPPRAGSSAPWSHSGLAKSPEHPRTPEEIVADKVNQFARDRRRIAHAMAKRFKVELPPEVDQFFEAVGAGRWSEHNALFEKIKQLRDSGQYEGLRTVFGPILEAQL